MNLFSKYTEYYDKYSLKINENVKQNLQNDLQFDKWNIEFTFNFNEIADKDLMVALKLFHEICRNLKEYLPLKNSIFESFSNYRSNF